MKLIRGIINLKNIENCVATIGNFDGVHLAHQQILKNLVKKSKELNIPSMVISFNPTPNNFFGKNHPVLSSLREKYELLNELGIDIFLIINFNHKFSSTPPQVFIDKILKQKLGVKHLFIGDDFHFGKNKKGTFDLLKSNITTTKINELLLDKVRVSSSNIRKYLATGDIKNATKMLGKNIIISGKVIQGKKLGRTIGVPTANIAIKNRNVAIKGVFATTIKIANKIYNSITNIGYKPTISGENKLSFEVNIFDFNADIYGEFAEVTILKKIRNEKKFSSLDELKAQIKQDIINCKN